MYCDGDTHTVLHHLGLDVTCDEIINLPSYLPMGFTEIAFGRLAHYYGQHRDRVLDLEAPTLTLPLDPEV